MASCRNVFSAVLGEIAGGAGLMSQSGLKIVSHPPQPSSPAAAIKEERSGLQRALHTKLDDHYPSKENQLLPNKIKFRSSLSKLNMKDYVRVLVEDADTANGRWWMSCQVAVVPHTLHRACTPWPIKITSPGNAKQNCGWINWVDITDPCLDHPWAIFFWRLRAICTRYRANLARCTRLGFNHPVFSHQILQSSAYLIFVTGTTGGALGEISVMWRNFKFLYMTDVEKSKISPHVD